MIFAALVALPLCRSLPLCRPVPAGWTSGNLQRIEALQHQQAAAEEERRRAALLQRRRAMRPPPPQFRQPALGPAR